MPPHRIVSFPNFGGKYSKILIGVNITLSVSRGLSLELCRTESESSKNLIMKIDRKVADTSLLRLVLQSLFLHVLYSELHVILV